MKLYKIVGLILESEEMPVRYEVFRCREAGEYPAEKKLKIIYRPDARMHEPFDAAAEASGLSIGRTGSGWIYEDRETGCVMRTDDAYSRAELSSNVKDHPALWGFLLQLFIECRLLDEGVITLHSSCVECRGKAYAFSGPPGCGKSTRALEWVKELDARFISGDRPAVDVKGKRVYGIPWDGKEQIFSSAEVPAGAVLVVRRAHFTRLRHLSPKQARDFLAGQIFIPMWDSERAAEAMILLIRLSGTIPVYRLFCDMGSEGAKETGNILFENEEKILEESKDMKLNDGFVLKSVAGENIIMPVGGNIARFNGTVILNEVSAFIVKQLEKGPVGKDDMLELILGEYEVDRETASEDLDELAEKLCGMGVISIE